MVMMFLKKVDWKEMTKDTLDFLEFFVVLSLGVAGGAYVVATDGVIRAEVQRIGTAPLWVWFAIWVFFSLVKSGMGKLLEDKAETTNEPV